MERCYTELYSNEDQHLCRQTPPLLSSLWFGSWATFGFPVLQHMTETGGGMLSWPHNHIAPWYVQDSDWHVCRECEEPLLSGRTHSAWLISFDSCFFIPHIIVPILLCFPYSALPILRSLTSFAPLNTAIMRWPGADAVDLYTVSCDWAAPIWYFCTITIVASVKLHTLDSELQFNSQN